MGWPRRLVFVRHAESEGNVLSKEERTRFPKSSHEYDLTPRGVRQAEITGEWLRREFRAFDVRYSSYYTRAKRTAEIMFPGERIYEDPRLAEAQRGVYHVITEEKLAEIFPWEAERKRRENIYHYRPWGGENWADVELRMHSFLGTLARDCAGLDVEVTLHGNLLVIARKLIHHYTIAEAIREFEESHSANASVTIYRGTGFLGRPWRWLPNKRLRLEAYNIVPWEGKI